MKPASPTLTGTAIARALGLGPALAENRDPIDPRHDDHSFANTDVVAMTQVYLHLDADFVAKRLKGYAELDFKRIDPAATTLILDTKTLDIAAVDLVTSAGLAPTKWSFGSTDVTLSPPLRIVIGVVATKVRITCARTD